MCDKTVSAAQGQGCNVWSGRVEHAVHGWMDQAGWAAALTAASD